MTLSQSGWLLVQPRCLPLPMSPSTPSSLSSPGSPFAHPLPLNPCSSSSGSRSVRPSVPPTPTLAPSCPFLSLSMPSSGCLRAPPLPSVSSFQRAREKRERERRKKPNPAASEIDALTPQLEAGTGVEPRPPSSARRGGEGAALGKDFFGVLIPFFPLLLPPSSAHSGASGTEVEKINK